MVCPKGEFMTKRLAFRGTFALVPGLHRLRKRLDMEGCFKSCTETDSCVTAVFDANTNKCAFFHLTDSNLELHCEEFLTTSSVRTSNSIHIKL